MSDITNTEAGRPTITSFEQMGIKNSFQLKTVSPNIQATEIIPLPGISNPENTYSVTCIKTPQPSGFAQYYSVILFGGKDSSETIGHLDFRIYNNKPEEARATESIYPEIQAQTNNLPIHLKNGIDAVSKMDTPLAMQIASSYQNKGLGGLLWSIGCGFAEIQGVKEIYIDDRTKQTTSGGFYERFGAYYKQGKQKKLIFGKNLSDSTSQQLYASAHLNDEQELIVRKAFNN